MREARRQEQLNNPHYLKGTPTSSSSSKNNTRNSFDNSVDSIPIAELNLSVPLKVAGEKRSDRYLNMDRQRKLDKSLAAKSQTNNKTKKKKKNKNKQQQHQHRRHKHGGQGEDMSSEDEDDAEMEQEDGDEDVGEDGDGGRRSTPPVLVNQSMDMPEGATLSDSASSHGPADDPHRALNIDLDTYVNILKQTN